MCLDIHYEYPECVGFVLDGSGENTNSPRLHCGLFDPRCMVIAPMSRITVAGLRRVAIEGSFPPDANKVTKIRESECCCHKLAVLFILQLDYRRFSLQETSLRWTAFIWRR